MELNLTEQVQKSRSEAAPYPPSYIDRLMRFVERLPVPYWVTYLLLFVLSGLLNHVLAWLYGVHPAFTFDSILLTYPLWLWIPLAIVTFLNRTAEGTLETFRPLLQLDDDSFRKLKVEFTTMPARVVLLNTLFWVVVSVAVFSLFRETFARYGFTEGMQKVTLVEGLITYGIGSIIYYHSLRQLWLINRTVKTVKQFNLFALDPVYAFSRLTAWTGISWMFMAGMTMLVFPMELASVLVIGYFVVQMVLAIAAFVLPLQFVSDRLRQEKRRLLAEHQRRVEKTLASLHKAIDQHELSEVGSFNTAIAVLNSERALLEKIPTLPWRTDTLTGFLSATGVPILLFVIQNILRRWLGD
ncbi:MAG TPA: hypothetical protein VFY26_17510 [Anaerolineales bacterium]|nr:hypothetical protein [Anaerolineales bacterium]